MLLASPASRCSAALDFAGDMETDVIPYLQDIDIGDWAGRTKDELRRHPQWSPVLRQIQDDAREVERLPGAEEDVLTFRGNAHQAFKHALSLPHEVVGLVTHSRAIEEIAGLVKGGKVQYLKQKEGAMTLARAVRGKLREIRGLLLFGSDYVEMLEENKCIHNGDAGVLEKYVPKA